VAKLEPAIEALRGDGIEPDPIIDFGETIPGCRLVFFRDPGDARLFASQLYLVGFAESKKESTKRFADVIASKKLTTRFQ
jgi:hypothetical protein